MLTNSSNDNRFVFSPSKKEDWFFLAAGLVCLLTGLYLKYYYYPTNPMWYKETRFNEHWFLLVGCLCFLFGLYKLLRNPFYCIYNLEGIHLPRWKVKIAWSSVKEIRFSNNAVNSEFFLILLVKHFEQIQNAKRLCKFADAFQVEYYEDEIPINISTQASDQEKVENILNVFIGSTVPIHLLNSVIDRIESDKE